MPKPATNPGQGAVKRRVSRPLGPRTLWLILKPGTDANSVREQIETATFNGRTVLKGMEGGVTPPVVKLTVETEKRGATTPSGDAPVAEADTLAVAAE